MAGRATPPVGAQRLPRPTGVGGVAAGSPRSAVMHPHPTHTHPQPPSNPFRCNAAVLTRCSPLTSCGGPGKRSFSSPETLRPRRRRRLGSPVCKSPRPGHRIPHTPALRFSRTIHQGENSRCVPSAPGAGALQKVTRACILKSNHFASCGSYPPRSAAHRPPGSQSQPRGAPGSRPQEAPAQPDLAAARFPGTVTADRAPGRSPRGPARTRFLEKLPTHLASLAAGAPYLRPPAPFPGALVRGAAEMQIPQDAYVNFPLPQVHARATKRWENYARPPLKEIISTQPHKHDVSKWHV